MRINTLLIVLILFYSCSPVSRTVKVGSTKKISSAKPIETINSNINKSSDNEIIDNDTIDIVLPEVKISVKPESKSTNTIHNFSQKESNNVDKELSIENLLEHVLNSGADDLEYDEEESRIICNMNDFGTVYKYFEDNKFEIGESKLEFIPQNYVTISNIDDAKKVLKCIDAFEDHDDVQNVYHNMEIDDNIANQID